MSIVVKLFYDYIRFEYIEVIVRDLFRFRIYKCIDIIEI